MDAKGLPHIYSAARRKEIALRFSVLLADRAAFLRRWKKYFDAGTWFESPAFGRAGNFEAIGYRAGSCPRAEFVHARIVNFPSASVRGRCEPSYTRSSKA